MNDEYAPAEFMSIPDEGVYDAFVVHLRLDADPRRRLCDGELTADAPLYDRASGNPVPVHKLVLCRACSQIMIQKSKEVKRR